MFLVVGLFLVGVVVSGAIAFLGNWVGRTVGRRKLTLFGMRPRHTSTIVTISTGVFIFLATALLLIAIAEPVRDMLLHEQQIHAQLDSSQKQLSDAIRDLAQVQSQQAQLREEIRKERLKLQLELPIYPMDATVYLRVIDCNASRELIEEQIDAALAECNRTVIEQKNAINEQAHQPLIPEDKKVVGIAGGAQTKDTMLDKLVSVRGQFVLELKAVYNEFEDDDTYPVNFELHPLVLCFPRGEPIASIVIPGHQSRVKVVEGMETFLRMDAKKVLKDRGLMAEAVFDISVSSLVNAEDRIVAAKAPVKLSVVPNRDIYNANPGHLDVRLVVSP